VSKAITYRSVAKTAINWTKPRHPLSGVDRFENEIAEMVQAAVNRHLRRKLRKQDKRFVMPSISEHARAAQHASRVASEFESILDEFFSVFAAETARNRQLSIDEETGFPAYLGRWTAAEIEVAEQIGTAKTLCAAMRQYADRLESVDNYLSAITIAARLIVAL